MLEYILMVVVFVGVILEGMMLPNWGFLRNHFSIFRYLLICLIVFIASVALLVLGFCN